MAELNPNAHWRDSARPIRFFIFDGSAAFPMVLFLMYMRLWTFILAFGTMLFFAVLKHFGFTPIVFFRWVRGVLAGPRKLASPWWLR